jgi:transcriptional regulator with XRE-family HTH domain
VLEEEYYACSMMSHIKRRCSVSFSSSMLVPACAERCLTKTATKEPSVYFSWDRRRLPVGLTLFYIVNNEQAEDMKDNDTKERFVERRARGWPFNKIADEIGVSKPTLINWERDLKESIDNLQAAELEAMYDKYYLSVREGRFFDEVLSRIRSELETRDLSTIPTEKLFATYENLYQEVRRALPEIAFRDQDEIRASRAERTGALSDSLKEPAQRRSG